jgi:hypothetical protein
MLSFHYVTAHLSDETTSELTLLSFSKHYDIVFLQVVSLKPCLLVRNKDVELVCRRTTLRAFFDHQKNHYLFISGKVHKVIKDSNLLIHA